MARGNGYEFETIEEIIEVMQKKTASYVPEWRFLPDTPDIGSALALVYGQMLFGTVKKFQYVPFKNQISFFNELDASLLPAIPSKGYLTFRMANDEVDGEEISAGLNVIAPAQRADEQTVSFETLEDVFVTPARVSCMLQVSGRRDFIGTLDTENLSEQGAFLYACKTENLQRHRFYFCHDDAFSIAGSGRITVEFYLHEESVSLENKHQMEFFYSTEDGYVPFRFVEQQGNRLIFVIGKNDPPFAIKSENGKESYWIMCEMKDKKLMDRFLFQQLLLTSSNERTAPESIYADGTDIEKEDFFPFGEQFSDYSEVYFLSDDVFHKRGAMVTMSFNLSFMKIPVVNEDEDGTEYDWIMKKSDFKPDVECDITIEEVIWEYFNGYGWTSLFEKKQNSDIFSVKNGTMDQYKTMRFICPEDIQPILVNAKEGCYIRARVTKVNNLYSRMRTFYIAPVMDNVHFRYTYEDEPVAPHRVLTENNREWQEYIPGRSGFDNELAPFTGIPEEEEALYLGFDIAPAGEPVKILFDFLEQLEQQKRNLIWEYWGARGFKELDLVDETENMSKTGIVTILESRGFAKKELYGFEKYWIRILDVSDLYKNPQQKYPCLCGIYMNTVRIRQADRMETEYFHMEVYQENMQFPLLNDHIIEMRLWVNETGSLSQTELRELRRTHRLYPEYREDGELLRAWVEWEQVEDFLDSGNNDRHFMLEANRGSIRFGNGRRGRIPPASRIDNILAVYRTGGGSHTNVKAGAVSQTGIYVGFVNEVFNPKRLTGGHDAENIKDALRRNAEVLRHQNMAVTERDFEEIAMAASRNVRRVKCFSGYDAKEQKKNGAVTLVVLQDDIKNPQMRFLDIKAEIEHYMKDKVFSGLLYGERFAVIQPQFVELCIRAEVVVAGFNDIFRVKKQVQERLDQFLDPLSGNFDGSGWEIGSFPNSLQIRNAISDISELLYIQNVYMSAFIGENAGKTEVELERMRKQKYILPVSGKHDTVVRVR